MNVKTTSLMSKASKFVAGTLCGLAAAFVIIAANI
jgi:uncharacterized membrane protein YccC